MHFNEIDNEKMLRKQISAVRPILKKHNKVFGIDRDYTGTQLTMAHFCYSLRLDEIKSKINFSKKRLCLRVMESDAKGQPIAIYESGVDEKMSKYFQVFLDKKCYNYLISGVEKLKKFEKINKNGEIRYLRIAALNLEIVWLHYEDGEEDLFVLNQNFGEPQPVLTETQLLVLLNEMKYKLDKMDESMGG